MPGKPVSFPAHLPCDSFAPGGDTSEIFFGSMPNRMAYRARSGSSFHGI